MLERQFHQPMSGRGRVVAVGVLGQEWLPGHGGAQRLRQRGDRRQTPLQRRTVHRSRSERQQFGDQRLRLLATLGIQRPVDVVAGVRLPMPGPGMADQQHTGQVRALQGERIQHRPVELVRGPGFRRSHRQPLELVHLLVGGEATGVPTGREVLDRLALAADGIGHGGQRPAQDGPEPGFLLHLPESGDRHALPGSRFAFGQRPVVVPRAVHQCHPDPVSP